MSIYFFMLLIMALLLYKGIISSLVYAPKKIKVISAMALILMTFRYIALIILFIIQNQSYLYLLKPMVYTNLLCIPICGIVSVFIFARNNKIKLKKVLLISFMLCIVYLIVIYKSPVNVNISKLYGYTIELKLQDYYYIPILIISSILAIKGIELFNETYSNKLGAILIIMSSSITLVSVFLTSINTDFAWLLLGDISWIITMDYALIKFKR
jgi:hypothetical protein